jgi:hypothetical protein
LTRAEKERAYLAAVKRGEQERELAPVVALGIARQRLRGVKGSRDACRPAPGGAERA